MKFVKKLFQLLLNFFKPKLKQSDCFTSLEDLSIYNWNQINKTNDLSLLLKKKKDLLVRDVQLLADIYHELMNDYIKRFGVSREFKQILMKKREIALLKCDFILTSDKMLLTLIKIAEIELQEMIELQVESDFNEVKAVCEKHFGFRIDAKIVSVVEFQSYLELIKKQNGKEKD